MKTRDKLKLTASKNKSKLLMSSYRHLRNKVNILKTKLKRQYFAARVSKFKGNMKESWKVINYFEILKAFFVRHSSEYKTSVSDRKVNRNIYPDAVTCDRILLIDPKSGQLEPIHHCCLVEEL